MSCANCSQTNPIPANMLELIIGVIKEPATNVYVNFNNITRGQLNSYDTTTTDDGTIKLNVSDIMFPENHSFEITVTDKLEGTIFPFMIGGIEYDCITAQFRKQRDENNDPEIKASHTITMAE